MFAQAVAAGLLTLLVSLPPEVPPQPGVSKDGSPQPTTGAESFTEAYKRAGSPRLLVHADLAGSATRSLIDGFADRVKDLFQGAGVNIVVLEPQALSPEQLDGLRRAGSYEAARALGGAAGADLVLAMRLTEQAGGGSYTGTSVLVDLRRGSTLGRFSWDVVSGGGGITAEGVQTAASAVARRAMEDITKAYPPGGNLIAARRMTVRIAGEFQPAALESLTAALNASLGVSPGSVAVRADEATDTVRVATLDLMYGGEFSVLRRLVRRAVLDQMSMSAALIDAREGSVGVRLTPLALGPRERLLTGGARTNRNSSERDRLRLAYATAGKPAIGVMINAPAPGEGADPSSVVVGDRLPLGPGGSSPGYADQVFDRETRRGSPATAPLDLRIFEDVLTGRLADLGLRVQNMAPAQADWQQKSKPTARTLSDQELALELGRGGGAGVMLSGVARLTQQDTGQRCLLTVKAIDTSSGQILTTATAERLIAPGPELAQGVEELSAEVVGKVVVQLLDHWEATRRE